MSRFLSVLVALALIIPLSVPATADSHITLICEIQDHDADQEAGSSLEGETVTTTGVVYAVQSNGFYLQDENCDDDTATSDGIFVFFDAQPSLGDELEVTGEVDEFFLATEIVGQSLRLLSVGNDLPVPTPIDHEAAATPGYYETLEHMRVHLAYGQTYVGTNRFNESFLVPLALGDSIDKRVRRTDDDPGIFALDDGLNGGASAFLFAFDKVFKAQGPMAFTFGNYKLLLEAPVDVEASGDRPAAIISQPDGTLSVATWNLFNVFDEKEPDDSIAVPSIPPTEQAVKRAKIARAVLDELGSPAVIAVQEVENLDLLEAIADEINVASDGETAYVALLLEGNDIRGIDVGFLVDEAKVRIGDVFQIGKDAVSEIDEDSGEPICDGGEVGLVYDRVPLVVEVMAGGETFYVVSNHFKSKFGGNEENFFFELCRVHQAEVLIAGLDELGLDDTGRVIITGDFNSFRNDETVEKDTLDTFEDAGYFNQVDLIPEDRRFTFVFEGRVQFLDHLLVQRPLVNRVAAVDSSKLDSDVPFPVFAGNDATGWATSDHDPIVAYIELRGGRPGGR